MSSWRTLHLFDSEEFHENVIPELQGEKGNLAEICLDFLKVHVTGGIFHLSKSEINTQIESLERNIINISKSLNKEFKKEIEYQDNVKYSEATEGYYDFCRFFEYILFRNCADFFPHIPLYRSGMGGNFIIDRNSLSSSILDEIDDWNYFFRCDMTGIANWLTNEDVELLYLDKENLHFENNVHAEAFLRLLEIANKNKLGFIVGIDMREDSLKGLPQNRLVGQKVWEKMDTTGMIFRM